MKPALGWRYGGHTHAGQCISQKNLAEDEMVLAPFFDCADVDFLAAACGRVNASDFSLG